MLLAYGANDATFRPGIVRRNPIVLPDHFVVLRQRDQFALRHRVHHLVAARLELADQFGQRFGGIAMKVVHQDDTLAVLLELAHH
jgi:hypothetical protein